MSPFRILVLITPVILASFACDDARSRLDGVRSDASDRPPVDAAPDAMPVIPDAMPDAMPVTSDAMMAAPDAMPYAILDAMPPIWDAMPDTFVADAPVGGCRFEVRRVAVAELRDFEPIVDGETVYFGERGPNGFVRTVRARDRAPVGGPSDMLLAANAGAFLLVRPDGDGGQRLIYRDGDGDVPLADRFDFPYGGGPIHWQPPQWVEPGQAIYTVGGRLFHWRGGESRVIDDGVVEAALWRGQVGYVKQVDEGGDMGWLLLLDGQPLTEPLRRHVGGTATAGPDGFWVSQGSAVQHHGWDGLPRESWGLAPGSEVVAIDASAEAVVFTVRSADRPMELFFPQTHQRLPLPETGAATARLIAGQVAVAGWPDADAWCPGMARGRVDVLTRDGAAVALGDAHAGCLCCGRYWPRFVIDASPTTVAWNYAGPDGAPAIGIARLRCD